MSDPIALQNLIRLMARQLEDVEFGHRNNDDGFQYNDCDTNPCEWCRVSRHCIEQAKELTK